MSATHISPSSTPTKANHPGLRRARRHALACLTSLLISLPLAIELRPLWAAMAPLEGSAYLLAAFLFGAALTVLPIAIVVFGLLALWARLDVALAPPRLVSLADRACVALAIAVSYLPALAAVLPPARALITGQLSYRLPPELILRSDNPLAFWEGVVYWGMGATAFALFATLYWRHRLRVSAQ